MIPHGFHLEWGLQKEIQDQINNLLINSNLHVLHNI